MEKWWSDGAKAFFLEYPTHPHPPAFGLSDTYLSQDDFRVWLLSTGSVALVAMFYGPADCTVTTRDQTGIHTTIGINTVWGN